MRQSAPGVRDPGSAEFPPLIGGTESREWARRAGVVVAAVGGGRDPSSYILLAGPVISGALRDEDG